MKPENIISAAQARLNFCDPKYAALYKEINNQILEVSRTQSHVEVRTDVSGMIRDRIIFELSELGYKANYYHYKDTIFTLSISW